MKKKVNPIVILILIFAIALGVILYLYFKPTNSFSSKSTFTNDTASSDGITTSEVVTQTIENTLSSSGEIASALDEKLALHASYYFEKLLVDENVYIKEGTNIVEYTNGTYLTAPYDCVVVGTSVPNEDEICTTSHYVEIKSIESLSMNLSVSESDIGKIEVGDAVDITITSTNEKITGYITSVSEVGTYSSNGSYFTAVVTFENNGNLKIGMSATCEIIIEKSENVLAVPVEAVLSNDAGDYVVKVNNDGTTENVTVEKGISNDAYVEIKSGLSLGDKVQLTESDSSSSSGKGGFSFPGGENMPSGGDFPSGGSMPEMPSGGFSGGMLGGPQ